MGDGINELLVKNLKLRELDSNSGPKELSSNPALRELDLNLAPGELDSNPVPIRPKRDG
jgi:hypothetical protein